MDSDGDIILPGAFSKVLKSQSRPISMFYNHKSREFPVGKWLEMFEDDKGLFVRGELTPGLSISQDLKAAMEHGTVAGMSVGFLASKDDYSRSPTGRVFKSVSALREISICTQPANEEAQVSAMKSMEAIENIRDAEGWLRDSAGLSRTEAQAFIARVKSAIRSECEGGELDALLQRISDFPSKLKETN